MPARRPRQPERGSELFGGEERAPLLNTHSPAAPEAAAGPARIRAGTRRGLWREGVGHGLSSVVINGAMSPVDRPWLSLSPSEPSSTSQLTLEQCVGSFLHHRGPSSFSFSVKYVLLRRTGRLLRVIGEIALGYHLRGPAQQASTLIELIQTVLRLGAEDVQVPGEKGGAKCRRGCGDAVGYVVTQLAMTAGMVKGQSAPQAAAYRRRNRPAEIPRAVTLETVLICAAAAARCSSELTELVKEPGLTHLPRHRDVCRKPHPPLHGLHLPARASAPPPCRRQRRVSAIRAANFAPRRTLSKEEYEDGTTPHAVGEYNRFPTRPMWYHRQARRHSRVRTPKTPAPQPAAPRLPPVPSAVALPGLELGIQPISKLFVVESRSRRRHGCGTVL
ncbi:hypothetical protein B0H13DRAFT_1888281 [Mycena leptocephala]|nr:hypothetical protein B0H13DRAFT_1888281 [Mycena leptocephala]